MSVCTGCFPCSDQVGRRRGAGALTNADAPPAAAQLYPYLSTFLYKAMTDTGRGPAPSSAPPRRSPLGAPVFKRAVWARASLYRLQRMMAFGAEHEERIRREVPLAMELHAAEVRGGWGGGGGRGGLRR